MSFPTTYYKYEPFSYTFTGGSNFSFSGSSLVTGFCSIGAGSNSVVFASTVGFQGTGSADGEPLFITSSAGTTGYTLFINPARFQGFPTSIVGYLNEYPSISNALTPPSGLPSPLTTIYTVPTLPYGLAISTYPGFSLVGTPTLTSVTSNYLIIGTNSSNQTVTASTSIGVSGERVVLSASNVALNLTIGTPITVSNVTIEKCSALASSFQFSCSSLPSGLSFNQLPTPPVVIGQPLPISNGFYISGTPTTTNLTSNSPRVVTTTVTAKVVGAAATSTSTTYTFTYQPAILFSNVNYSSNIYLGIPITPFQMSAFIAFSGSGSVTYSSSNLPPGLLISSSGLVTGTPTVNGSTSSVITANSSTLSGSTTLPFKVSSNTVTVTCSNAPPLSYIVGRPITPVTFIATSAGYSSGGWLKTYAFSNLPSGLQSTATTSGTITLYGTPLSVSASTLRLTVTSVEGASGSVSVPYAVIADIFSFSTRGMVPFLFQENVSVGSIPFFASTVSGTAVTYFTCPNLPQGLTMTAIGELQGTPVTNGSGFLNVTATNGYTTQSCSPLQFPYTILPDQIHVTTTASTALVPGQFVSIPLSASTLSGLAVTSFSSLSFLYGLSFSNTTLKGTFGPGVILPEADTIQIVGSNAIGGTATTQIEVVPKNPPTVSRYTVLSNAGTYTVYSATTLDTYSPAVTVSTLSPTFSFQSSPSASLLLDGTPTYTVLPSGTRAAISSTNLLQCTYMSKWYVLANGSIVYTSPDLSGWTTYGTLTGITGIPRFLKGVSQTLFIGANSLYSVTVPGTTVTTTTVSAPTSMAASASTLVVTCSSSPIQYSTTMGVSWLTANNAFTTGANSVVYGAGWLAASTTSLKFCADDPPVNWVDVPLPVGATIGPIQYDGTYWCVFLNSSQVYYHDANTATMTNAATWTSLPLNTPSGTLTTFPPPLVSSANPTYQLLVGTTLTGPVFLSPTVTNYALSLFVPITPIQFLSGTGTSYFLDTTTLPPGMIWTTNVPTDVPGQYVATLTGRSMQTGTFAATVYAQSDLGASSITLSFVVNQLYGTTEHSTISAYTAFQREKVLADAAASSINNHSLTPQVGPFLLPRPPAIETVPSPQCQASPCP